MGRKRWRTWSRKNINRKSGKGARRESKRRRKRRKKIRRTSKKMGVKGEEEEMEPPLFRVFRTKHNHLPFHCLRSW